MFVERFFLVEGFSGIYRYKSGKEPNQKLQRFCKKVWKGKDFKIYDVRKSSYVYGLASGKKKLALEVDEFSTKDKEKRICYERLIETEENRKWFSIGSYAVDGFRNSIQNCISLYQKHKIARSSIIFRCQSLVLQTNINRRVDKFNIFELITMKKQSVEEVHRNKNLGEVDDHVFDFETETHDFICGFLLIVHNRDSFVLIVKTENKIKV